MNERTGSCAFRFPVTRSQAAAPVTDSARTYAHSYRRPDLRVLRRHRQTDARAHREGLPARSAVVTV